MLRMENSNVNFNGTSMIEDVVVASMNANASGASVYINFNIDNIALYNENKTAVEADFNEFKERIFETVNALG